MLFVSKTYCSQCFQETFKCCMFSRDSFSVCCLNFDSTFEKQIAAYSEKLTLRLNNQGLTEDETTIFYICLNLLLYFINFVLIYANVILCKKKIMLTFINTST